ncbi:hypothetical protein ACP4OV_005695 [Aristida adscensionis]
MASPPTLCVTGASGFIASWLVKLLLSRGYAVHATLRNPSDPKNAFLKQLDKAPEKLRLFKADVLDRDALAAAVAGCEGVFHVACPVPSEKANDPESEVLAPAVKGTLNILEACSANNVKKVIVVSSTAALHFNPSWPQGKPKDESCWSDKQFCMKNEDWYMVAKTVAEEKALEYAEKNGLTVVTVVPCMALGPLLQPLPNISSQFLIYIIKGGPTVMKNMTWYVVDVRDLADAFLLIYEKSNSSGRYVCAPDQITTKDLVNLLKKTRPSYNYVKCDNDLDGKSIVTPITSEKLNNLGWKPTRKIETTILESIEYYEKARLLQDVEDCPCRLPQLFHMATDK